MNRWQKFYNDIRDPSWPDCYNEHHFLSLPESIKKEILQKFDGAKYLRLSKNDLEFGIKNRNLNNVDTTESVDLKYCFYVGENFAVYYGDDMEDSGTEDGQDFPRIVRYLYPDRVFSHCLDWCAGAGFIGFRLLADGICHQLTLLEAFEPCTIACRKTIDNMPEQYKNYVNIILGSSMGEIPAQAQFDLIIGNPPPTSRLPDFAINLWQNRSIGSSNRVMIDENWSIHKNFFSSIKKNLSQNGVIILKNNTNFSSVSEFESDIHAGGLMITNVFKEKNYYENLWYLVLGHQQPGAMDYYGRKM